MGQNEHKPYGLVYILLAILSIASSNSDSNDVYTAKCANVMDEHLLWMFIIMTNTSTISSALFSIKGLTSSSKIFLYVECEAKN